MFALAGWVVVMVVVVVVVVVVGTAAEAPVPSGCIFAGPIPKPAKGLAILSRAPAGPPAGCWNYHQAPGTTIADFPVPSFCLAPTTDGSCHHHRPSPPAPAPHRLCLSARMADYDRRNNGGGGGYGNRKRRYRGERTPNLILALHFLPARLASLLLACLNCGPRTICPGRPLDAIAALLSSWPLN